MRFQKRMTGTLSRDEGCNSGRGGWRTAGCLVLAMLGTSAISSTAELPSTAAHTLRVDRLKAFFNAHSCPAPLHIEDYLRVADTYGIDYRLLPALSVRESTCGRYERMNNRWGWDSARTGFKDVQDGIQFVARQLAYGRAYRGKSTEDKLRAYNPNPLYAEEVRKLMLQIEAD